jgi:hypothetical protein
LSPEHLSSAPFGKAGSRLNSALHAWSTAVALAPLLIVIGFSAARADEPPARKPGLWEVTMSLAGIPPTRLCVDAASEAEVNAKSFAVVKELCSKFESHRAGAVYTQDSVCKPANSTQTSHKVMTFRTDIEYTLEATTHFDPPFMGRSETKTTQTGKWVGPCGPDMKPGDMLINGNKIHVGGQPQ